MSENTRTLAESLEEIKNTLQEANQEIAEVAIQASQQASAEVAHNDPFIITGLTVFLLACFVGYHVVWRVTPALHSPLMGITNAISSVIIVGALMALWPEDGGFSLMGFIGVILASINIFGGFIITRRMLHMFKKKGA
jgi:NAD(P) transhydrogenase subunit alpha